MKNTSVIALILIALINISEPYDLESQFKQMVQSERNFAKASVDNGMREAFLAYLGEDSVVFKPGPTSGKAWAEKLPRENDGILDWHPSQASISASGDIGYISGPWTYTDKNKPEEIAYGHFNSVWKKQADGSWKNVCDFGISHPAPKSADDSQPRWEAVAFVEPAADIQSARDALLNADRQFSKALTDEGAASAYRSSLAPNARLYRNGMFPLIETKAIQDYLSKESVQQRCEPIYSEVSQAGDLGFTYGSITTKDKPEQSYYMRIWKKQPGGTWKMALDVNNTK